MLLAMKTAIQMVTEYRITMKFNTARVPQTILTPKTAMEMAYQIRLKKSRAPIQTMRRMQATRMVTVYRIT